MTMTTTTTTKGERTRLVRGVIRTMDEPFSLLDVQAAVATHNPSAASCVSAVLTHDAKSGALIRTGRPHSYRYTRAPRPEPLPLPNSGPTLEERIAALEATIAALRAALGVA